MKPVVRREVAGHLPKAYGISERRACSATGFKRSSQRYRKRSDPQTELRMRFKELAAARVRFSIENPGQICVEINKQTIQSRRLQHQMQAA